MVHHRGLKTLHVLLLPMAGKDGHPFPVPIKVYDETISTLQTAVHKAKLGQTDKQQAIKALHTLAAKAEKDFIPNERFEELVEKERNESWKYGGKTVFAMLNHGEKLKVFN